MVCRYALMTVLLLYMGALVLSAWQAEVRPTFLDRAHDAVYTTVKSVGIRAGMPVFIGSVMPMESLIRERCTIVTGVDAEGRRTRLHPDACPPEGLRWKPVVYDHMIVHWTQAVDGGDRQANLVAIADHFCHRPGAERYVSMKIEKELPVVDYLTGAYETHGELLGTVRCRRKAPEVPADGSAVDG